MPVRGFFSDLSPVLFWVILALIVVAGAAAFITGVRRLRHATVVANTPTSALRSAAQGFGEFEGRADLLPGLPIVAPLTGTVCVWYHCMVWEQRREGREWGVITDETSDGLFLLRDHSGTSVIDPEGAVVKPSTSLAWYTDSVMSGPPPTVGSALMGRYRCREERIDLRARLYVMGNFTTHGASQEVPDTPAEIRSLLNSWKRDQTALVNRFDANGDGVLDAQEWEAVRRAAAEEVGRMQRERFGDGTVNLISKPRDGRAFIISTAGEEALIRRWRRQSLFYFAGFVAAAWLAAWAVSVRW